MLGHSKIIAQALTRIHEREDAFHSHIVQTNELSRSDRELLLKTGWLREILKGWYLLVKPDVNPNDSTPWFAHFWDFLAVYLNNRFGKNYCLSAENSLDVLIDVPLLPRQVIVIVPHGGGKAKTLPFETSLLMYSDPKNIPDESGRIERKGLQIMSLPLAICRVSPIYFRSHPTNAEIALRTIRTAAELSKIIIQYNFKTAAGRLIGAYRFLGDNLIAEHLEKDLKTMGIFVSPENPFDQMKPLLKTLRPKSPYVARIEALWQNNREKVIEVFPKPPTTPIDAEQYMKNVDEIYQSDAYNSLSIEGYQITRELIEKVKNNNWNPNQHAEDREQKNALAARGYYEAFQLIKGSVREIITTNRNSGDIAEENCQDWYRALFAPSVNAGIISPNQLLGYRTHPVYIRNSRHVPLPAHAIVDTMEFLFHALKEEPEASVRAILGHYIFVFIHPYMDGNGRIARFLMNAMLASGGYSWIVVPLVKRNEYMNALSIADTNQNLKPFAQFISDLFKEYTFHDIVILNAIKDIIKNAGYNLKDFEIRIWDLQDKAKNITLCHKSNRKSMKDFTPCYPPYENPQFLKEISLLFYNPKEMKRVFSI